jgi:hypothetical protein
MKFFTLSALIPLLFVGCVSEQSNLYINPRTLGGSIVFPRDEIAEFYGSKAWQSVRSQEYSGYVIMTGLVDPYGEVGDLRIVQSFPDASRDRLARQLAKDVKIQSLRIDSAIWPAAEVYVIFYESFQENRAVIYAKRSDYSGRSSFADGKIKASYGDGRYFHTTTF